MIDRQIELRGGPLDGVIHELYGQIMPAAIFWTDDDGIEHRYDLNDDATADYKRPEGAQS